MVEIERAGHWTGQLEWLPTDRFAKSAPDWAAPEMLGRALSAETRPNFFLGSGTGPEYFWRSNILPVALRKNAVSPDEIPCKAERTGNLTGKITGNSYRPFVRRFASNQGWPLSGQPTLHATSGSLIRAKLGGWSNISSVKRVL